MQDKRGLDPQAKEFVPMSWFVGKGKQHVDTRYSVTAISELYNAQRVSYRSALVSTVVASSHEISKGMGMVVSETTTPALRSSLDMEKLLQNRRLSKPKKSVLVSQRQRWIDIAHKQAACLGTSEPSIVKPDLESVSLWHRVLSQSDSSSRASTFSLLHAEAPRSQPLLVKATTEDSASNELHSHSTYDAWWHAVFQADYAAMAELINQHRASWDCTFANEMCSETVRVEMTTLCASISFFSSANSIAEQSTEGLNALHVCSLHSRHALCLEQFVQRNAVRVHLDCHERTHKRTALHFASWAGNFEAVKTLVAYGADVTLKDRHGNTALHFATRVGNLPIVTLLCEKSRKVVNTRNKASETPLLLAGSRAIAQVLITAGADVTTLNADGLDAATLAARVGHSSLLEALLNVNSSHRINKTQVHANLSSSAVNSKQANQRTHSSSPLHQAAQHGHTACIKLLLNRCSSCRGDNNNNSGVQVNTMHDCEMHGTDKPSHLTPLMHAGMSGHADIFTMLLLHGANPAQETLSGGTALTLSMAAPSVSVKFLQKVFFALSEQQYPIDSLETLLTNNTRRVSVLAIIALEALKHHRPSFTTPLQELRVSVLQEYVPKFALLLAGGAPLHEDFVKLMANPVCIRHMHHFGVNLRLPVEEWRQFLHNAVLPEEFKNGDDGLEYSKGAKDSTLAAESFYSWLKHDYQSVLDPPLVIWGYADVRVILCNRHGEVSEERFCHSFLFHTERCGVLKTMVASPLAKKELISEGEGNAGEMRVVLSFPHVSVELFDALLQWLYTGRDVICADILLQSPIAPGLGVSRGKWIDEWVLQRQSTATFALALLYLANELLIHELQQLCEKHLCDLHTALPDEEVQLLVKTVDCPVFGPFLAIGHRVSVLLPTEKHTEALNRLLQEASLTAPPLLLTLLRHGVSVLQVFCEDSDLSTPLCVTRMLHHITQTEQRVRQAYMADCKGFPGDEKQTEPIPLWVELYVKKLLFSMHSWIQRVHLHRKMTNFDVKIAIHLPLTPADDANECIADPGGNTEESVFYAHGALLAQESPKFASMIRFTQLPRALLCDKEQMLTLSVQYISAAAMEALLCSCYTGVLPSNLLSGDADVVQNLLLQLVSVADQYLIPALSALLVRLLIQRLNTGNAVCFFETACLHQLGPLAIVSALHLLKQGTSSWIDGTVPERTNIVDFYESVLRYLLEPAANDE